MRESQRHELGLRGDSLSRSTVKAEPEPDDAESEKRADGIDQGVVGRGLAAGDEGLVDFVERGIAARDEERSQSPGPAPADVAAANAAKEKRAEDEVLGEVGALANVMMDEVKLGRGQIGFEPAKEGFKE